MIRSLCESWYLCAWFVVAALSGIAIASSFLIGDKAAAQQAQSKPDTLQRFNFSRKPKPKPKRNKPSAKPRPQPGKLAIPGPETLLTLVRLYLVALDQAIKANDFRVLHTISAPALRSSMSVDQLAAAFADLRSRKVDLGAVVIVTPQITESPKMLPGNILNIVGHFPTAPQRINFHMQFQPAQRQWRLRGMQISANPVDPVKPKTAAPNPKPKKKKRTSAAKR